MSGNNRALRVLLYEGEGAAAFDHDSRYAAVNALLEKGYTVTRATNPASESAGALCVLGRFGGTPPPFLETDPAQSFRDVTGFATDQVVLAVESLRTEAGASPQGAWKPWFPVIDYDRCTNCMQCLSFCLFGVYGVDGGKRIQVQNNDQCKTNCPACSRVCPEAAIMFPKYKAGPINGDVVSDADLQKEKMKVDISALLGGDVYAMLRLRSEKAKSRFSKERDSDKALAERQKCLVKLANSGAAQMMAEIPPEVLMSLPSAEEIQRRAEEAARKAQVAIADRDA